MLLARALASSRLPCLHSRLVCARSHAASARWKQYNLSGSGARSSVSMLTDDGYSLTTDTPKNMGGNAGAPQPVQMFLAALVGCEQATASFVARKLRIAIKQIDFDIHAVRDEWGSMRLPLEEDPAVVSRLQRIWGTALVQTEASQEDVTRMADLVKVRCPLANMVILSGCKLDVDWIKVEPTVASV